MPDRYQYQPLTGPIFRGAVAATLAWLPIGNPQPLRSLPRPPPTDYTVAPLKPLVAAYDPAGLQWNPPEYRVPRALVNRLGDTVNAPRQYDPATLSWLPSEPRFSRELPRLRLGETVAPPRQYDPASLSWLPSATRWIRPEVRRLSETVQPFVIPAQAYDPAGLQWLPVAPQRVLALPGLRLGDIVTAPRQYDPAGIQWIPTETRCTRLETRRNSEIVEPFFIPAPAYDPAGLQWLATGRLLPRDLPRASRPESIFLTVLQAYNPAGLQWLPTGPGYVRALPIGRVTWTVLDPFPRPPVAFDPAFFRHETLRLVIPRTLLRAVPASISTVLVVPQSLPLFLRDESGPFFLILDRSGLRYALIDQSQSRYADVDVAAEQLVLVDQSGPRFLIQLGPELDVTVSSETIFWSDEQWRFSGFWIP